MGHVYRATGPDGQTVALKLVKEDLARDETFRRRFDREARIAQRVRHLNVVEVLDQAEHEGIPYLVQRYVPGGNLAELIEKHGQLDLSTTVRICQEVASGLGALHEQGLFHRDIKPGNILIDEQSTAHITDFGLAKDSQGSLLTRPGQALGSMDYMAPEQIRSDEITAAADIYALGCVMYECLCGEPPFAGREGMRILWAHLQDPPDDPANHRSELPRGVSSAILQALDKEAEGRQRSAVELAEQMEAAARG